ncbi:hypothetical protein HMI49_41215 [Corallococcus exercitus]|uniref:Uncharacterized protein n=1 Tax=Corallococcus exercitus TaxID=2316736 RepID=A0A7Y4KV82_9BACT|nr:hypothetical protein [Corallococcus exercitus]NOK39604.1 hypothetical protein [Corallococcus exercitus]
MFQDAVHIPRELLERLEAFPLRPRLAVRLRLLRLAEAADSWPPEDARWAHVAQADAEGWRFYTQGCCVQVRRDGDAGGLRVHALGRVVLQGAALRRGPS